jgi:hypothetical protein
MKTWLKRSVVIVLAVVLAIIPVAVLANWLSTPAVVTSDLSVNVLPTSSEHGITFQPDDQTFYAVGRHWIFYVNDDSDIVYKSALSDGVFGIETDVVTNSGLYGWECAVFYDVASNTVHYARHDMNTADPDDDTVNYRMGTPSIDGTITWAAAEQTVLATPAKLLNWRTTITVDESGYPWIAWVDTNGVNSYGVVYVEGTSTKDGTWTTDNSKADMVQDADYTAWFVSLTPIADTPHVVQLAWSREDNSEGANNGKMSLIAQVWDVVLDDWHAPEEVVPIGHLNVARPDAFDFYDLGSSMYVVWTDEDGDVSAGVRSSIESWVEGDFAEIKDGAIPYYPTISGYRLTAGGGGEDLICIVHSDVDMDYAVHAYIGDISAWTDWTAIWVVPDLNNDLISRHIATYTYPTGTSLLGFAWQWYDDSEDLDTVNYWWIDEGQLGYYAGSIPAAAIPVSNLIPLVFIAMGILLILGLVFSDNLNMQSLIIIAIIIIILVGFLSGINTQINNF